ncbi:hypothetical protein JOC69_001782 [Heliobacterium gestii]|nr:hypothetical protein [Heliomicrobium gestii]
MKNVLGLLCIIVFNVVTIKIFMNIVDYYVDKRFNSSKYRRVLIKRK